MLKRLSITSLQTWLATETVNLRIIVKVRPGTLALRINLVGAPSTLCLARIKLKQTKSIRPQQYGNLQLRAAIFAAD